MLTRREFMIGAAGAAAGTAMVHAVPTLWTSTPRFDLTLYTTGRMGNLYQGAFDIYGTTQSVVTALDMATGKARHVLINVFEAHYVVAMNADRLLVIPQNSDKGVILDRDLRLVRDVMAPDGFGFSGHALALPEHGVVAISYYKNNTDNKVGTDLEGRIELRELQDYSLVDQFGSGGVRPHDMCMFADGKRIALAHAGELGYVRHLARKQDDSPLADSYLPKLSIVDIEKREAVATMKLDGRAPMIHLAVDAQNNVYGVLQKYIDTSPGRRRDDIMNEIGAAFGTVSPPALNAMEVQRGGEGIALPLPMMRFDTHAGSISEIFTDAAKQRRSQSVICQQATGSIIATYVFTEHLLRVRADGTVDNIATEPLGIQNPIGLCDIPGTPYFALAGMFNDIVVIDARDMNPVQRFRAPLYRSSHLTPVAM